MAYNIVVSSSGTAISRTQFGIPVRDAINDLDTRVGGVEAGTLNKPFFQAYKTGNQTISNNVEQSVVWDLAGETIDTHDMHKAASLDRVVPTVPGIYRVTFSVFWNNNSSGQRVSFVSKGLSGGGGGNLVPADRLGTVPNISVSQRVTRSVKADGLGDYIFITVFQNSGGNLDILGNPNESSAFGTFIEVEFIRPLP